MGLPFEGFECDRCGACCSLLVEAGYVDVLREPRLLEADPVDLERLRDGCVVILYDSVRRACPFLGSDMACGVYATRPGDCVRVEAGDYKCQYARWLKGLPVLADRSGCPPRQSQILESCDEYGSFMEDDFLGRFPAP